MIKTINGSYLFELIEAGIKNLEKNRQMLNDLNVFPVPDGDTGTNMLMTMRGGFASVNASDSLSDTASKFAQGAVFGARGNSGVIISQFFKGLAAKLDGCDEADAQKLCDSLKNGVALAYSAVANPVEGTMLTVLREASYAASGALPVESIDEAIKIFVTEAKASLQRTPDLLPVLKKAGVVDSGACGVVCIFEGMLMQLSGQSIDVEQSEDDVVGLSIDLDRFNKDTSFKHGYCVEGIIQLTIDECDFVHDAFKREICAFGSSLVSSVEGDKIKLHVHVKSLGDLFNYCRRFGEFLTVKIENMSVQQIMTMPADQIAKKTEKFMVSDIQNQSEFAIVAVATTPQMQKMFSDMGADVVIFSELAPSAQDFLDAFELTSANEVIVFPNSSNSILVSMQAASFYKKGRVTVLNSRSMAECYACLSVVDFEASPAEAIALANQTVSEIYRISVYRAEKDVTFGSKIIRKNEFFALADKEILSVGDTLANATVSSIKAVLDEKDCSVLTLFYGKDISDEYIEILSSDLSHMCKGTEIATVATHDKTCDLTITFE